MYPRHLGCNLVPPLLFLVFFEHSLCRLWARRMLVRSQAVPLPWGWGWDTCAFSHLALTLVLPLNSPRKSTQRPCPDPCLQTRHSSCWSAKLPVSQIPQRNVGLNWDHFLGQLWSLGEKSCFWKNTLAGVCYLQGWLTVGLSLEVIFPVGGLKLGEIAPFLCVSVVLTIPPPPPPPSLQSASLRLTGQGLEGSWWRSCQQLWLDGAVAFYLLPPTLILPTAWERRKHCLSVLWCCPNSSWLDV